MCGIFGYFDLKGPEIFYDLGKHSETRGKEASGYISVEDAAYNIKKFPLPFSNNVVKTNLFENNNKSKTYIGHTRLKTHGDERLEKNNQPISSNDTVIVHNGIIVNYKDIQEDFNFKTDTELDSEVIPLLMNHYLTSNSLLNALKLSIKQLSGEVSISGVHLQSKMYFLYTNTGSIYYLSKNNKIIFFSSEEWITREIKRKYKLSGKVKNLKPNTGLIIDSNNTIEELFVQECLGVEKNTILLDSIIKNFENKSNTEPVLNRCSKCILPDTVPFIEFDKDGICNFCKEQQKYIQKNISKLYKKLKNEKNIVVGFSGGRDSSYGLSFLKNNLDSNFIAVSYDWGMITDLARRNQARVVGKLGVEHVWVSANITKKRQNIKKNLLAWLANPDLGMVPILMAGDKEWQKKLINAANNKNSEYIVQFQSPFEHTYFKYGFAGIKPLFSSTNETESKLKEYTFLLRLILFYGKNFLKNPRYINLSILDSIKGFFTFYLRRGKIISLFEYLNYEEREVNNYLQENFSWECDPTTPTTWRIGDGTAAIYNYIYWLHAGFTENDFYRSNQIREGQISREEGMKMISMENQPRLDAIKNYCELIDVDYDFVMESLKKVKNNSLVDNWKT